MDGSAAAVGRIMAPLLGAPERGGGPRAARRRLPADELHPRRARGLRDGPRLPARACPRTTWPSGRPSEARARARRRGGRAARASCSPPPRTCRRRATPRSRSRDADGARRLRARARPRRAARLRRRPPPRRRCRRGRSRGRCCARDRPPHEARGRAHAARRRARRRPGLRRVVRGPRRRARARGQRRRRARGRPLRGRGARDERLRRADAVAARDGRRGRDPPGASVHALHHAARQRPAAGCRGAGRRSTTAQLCELLDEQNDARFETAKVERADGATAS